MLRRHFLTTNTDNSENLYGDYDWCVKYTAKERIKPFGRDLEEITELLKAEHGSDNINYYWLVNNEPVNLTCDIYDSSTGEGVFGFTGNEPGTYFICAEINTEDGTEMLPIASFNAFIEDGNDSTSAIYKIDDYNVTKIECPDNISIIFNMFFYYSIKGFHILDDYIHPKNLEINKYFYDTIPNDAPFLNKSFIFKKEYTTDMKNSDPLDFAHQFAKVSKIIVEDGHSTYDSRENCGCIIETATNTLLVGCSDGFIPNTVTSLGNSCFYKSRIKEISIPDSIDTIPTGAFYSCTNLISITIPNSITYIGSWAFNYCSSLISLTIPNSVTSIGNSAFLDCSSLTSIVIGNGVTSIGECAFSGCKSLTSITIPNSVTSIGDYFLRGTYFNIINFEGTIEQWDAVEKGSYWKDQSLVTVVHCTDGDVPL